MLNDVFNATAIIDEEGYVHEIKNESGDTFNVVNPFKFDETQHSKKVQAQVSNSIDDFATVLVSGSKKFLNKRKGKGMRCPSCGTFNGFTFSMKIERTFLYQETESDDVEFSALDAGSEDKTNNMLLKDIPDSTFVYCQKCNAFTDAKTFRDFFTKTSS